MPINSETINSHEVGVASEVQSSDDISAGSNVVAILPKDSSPSSSASRENTEPVLLDEEVVPNVLYPYPSSKFKLALKSNSYLQAVILVAFNFDPFKNALEKC